MPLEPRSQPANPQRVIVVLPKPWSEMTEAERDSFATLVFDRVSSGVDDDDSDDDNSDEESSDS